MTENFKNSYKSNEKTIVALSVYNVGYQKCEALHQWGPGIRDHYLIHYVVSGQGYYETGGQLYQLKAGDVFLIYPGVPITYYADETFPWEYYWVGFNGGDAPSIISATPFSMDTPVIHDFSFGEELKKGLLDIYERRGTSLHNTLEMTGQLYHTLALFIGPESSGDSDRTGSARNYVNQAVEYINGHYAYPISVEDISDYVGISRSQLYRAFMAVMNQSPKEYLTAFRMKQARQLLKTTALPINTIACSAGFENNLYFSKVFHKVCGMSPSNYRMQYTPAVRHPM